jgi:hypothetical protein
MCATLLLVACGGKPAPARSPTERANDSAAAVSALQASRFVEASNQATIALSLDSHNSRAAAVHAIAAYQAAGARLRDDIEEVVSGSNALAAIDHEQGRAAWQRFADALAAVDRDLAIVARDPAFSLELCIACWEHDWNHTGEIDDRDRQLFEIEFDGLAKAGSVSQLIPPGDPRRRPTFRFDVGDAEWARAMVSFQRALMELILAYRWSELDPLFAALFGSGEERPTFEIPLQDAGRVTRAHQLILAGLGAANRCRAAYLVETDDDREWVPNPTQQSHPIPLQVDAALYQTWAEVTGDLQRMLRSEEGLSLRGLAALGDRDSSVLLPDAFIDLGALLRTPRPLRINTALIARLDFSNPAEARPVIEQLLRGILGNGYAAKMKPSPLLGRLSRMKDELSTGNDTFDRKLRYLLWLN